MTIIYTLYKSHYGSNVSFDEMNFKSVTENVGENNNYQNALKDIKLLKSIKDKAFEYIKNKPTLFGIETGFSIHSDAIGCLNSYSARISIPSVVTRFVNDYLQLNQFFNLTQEEAVDLLIIIVEESVRQSGKSKMGSNLEEIINKQLTSQGAIKISGPRRDRKYPNLEYDRIYKVGRLIVGLSSKRSLRERWRMNIANISQLEVDVLLHCSLGFDLPVSQMESHPGHLLIVPDDFSGLELDSDSVFLLSWVNYENLRTYLNSVK